MKRILRVLTVFSLAALVIAACASPTPAVVVQTQVVTVKETSVVTVRETQVVEVQGEQTVVRLSGWASSPSETALLESLLYKFSVENPDILVKYEPITGDYKQSLLTSVAAGTEPDVYYADIFWFQEFARNEVLLPMDDLMASTGTSREDFVPALIDAFTFDGKTYGIPKDFNTLGLFYNKDLFDKAGLDYPTDDWTWEDLQAAAEALTDTSDPNKPIYGLGVPPDQGRFPIFAFQNGSGLMTDDFSDTILDSEEAVAAAQFYTDFKANGSGALPSDVGEGWQGTVFGKGQFAMVYEGGWLIPYLREQFPGVKYGVVMPPAGPAGEGNLIFTVSWSISANTKNPEASWRVVDFLTNEASQKQVLESGFALPTRDSLKDSDFLKNNPNSAAIFNGSFNNAKPFFFGPVTSDVLDQTGKALERIMKEGQSPADSLKDAAEEVRKAIESQ